MEIALSWPRQTVSKLRVLGEQQNVSLDQLIIKLLDSFDKGVYKSDHNK
jgi:hypothetical protein